MPPLIIHAAPREEPRSVGNAFGMSTPFLRFMGSSGHQGDQRINELYGNNLLGLLHLMLFSSLAFGLRAVGHFLLPKPCFSGVRG